MHQTLRSITPTCNCCCIAAISARLSSRSLCNCCWNCCWSAVFSPRLSSSLLFASCSTSTTQHKHVTMYPYFVVLTVLVYYLLVYYLELLSCYLQLVLSVLQPAAQLRVHLDSYCHTFPLQYEFMFHVSCSNSFPITSTYNHVTMDIRHDTILVQRELTWTWTYQRVVLFPQRTIPIAVLLRNFERLKHTFPSLLSH